MLSIYELNEEDIVFVKTSGQSSWIANTNGTYSKSCSVTLIDGFVIRCIYKTITKQEYFKRKLMGK